ncbi:hypothetical protein BH11VER1_BH11VER1_04280 [soil metagenome]
MSPQPQRDQRALLTLVEEATHLLRRTPLSAWLAYYVGSIPFCLYLFFFWSDMSRSPFAAGRLLGSSLILTLLYGWMKVWQAIFCDQLMAIVEGRESTDPLVPKAWIRLIASQVCIHASMLWVLPLALVAMLPFGWVYAFYHNVTVLAVGHFRREGRTASLFSKALGQSHYHQLQNHSMLIMALITAVLVYMNLFVGFIMSAQLLSSFSGLENAFTQNLFLMFSSTVQALLISLSYLVMNPIVKSLYVLRCFYGAARKSGADIEVRLRAITMAKPVLLILVLTLVLSFVTQTTAQETAPAKDAAMVQTGASQLNDSISKVMQSNEYQWRMPRDMKGESVDESWLGSIVRAVKNFISDSIKLIGDLLGDLIDWIFGGKDKMDKSSGGTNSVWLAMLPKLLIVLLVLLATGFLLLLYRNWRLSQQTQVVVAAAAPPEINLESENVLATQLPENEWLRLAREKMESGDLRLALRALFLATLANLGEKRLLQISRAKSNGDYVREIGWRAKDRDELNRGFTEQVRTFDRVWYGWHEVDLDLMKNFELQHERITSHAA